MNSYISIQIPDHRFFKLPFKTGTRALERETLDSLSEFRRPKRYHFSLVTKNLSFINEILTASIKIEKEDPEKVYLKVTETQLLISCSMDTDEAYLSRYSYFFLDNYLSFYNEKSFEDYYYPDLFDPVSGTSKYLKIINNGKRVSVEFKHAFRSLFRPGHQLPQVPISNKIRQNIIIEPETIDKSENKNHIIGYCLLAPTNWHERGQVEKELPLLIPFAATLNNDQRNFRSMLTYIRSTTNTEDLLISDNQMVMNDVCEDMWENSLFFQKRSHRDLDSRRSFEDRKVLQFDLWKNILPLIIGQKFICHQWTYGLKYLTQRPVKKDIRSCQISSEIPQLKFILTDKGEYYFLDLKFMVNGKLLKFQRFSPFYFAISEEGSKRFFQDGPKLLYLLGSLSDAEMTGFFSKANFRIVVLKKHYDGYFRNFVDNIKKAYSLTEK